MLDVGCWMFLIAVPWPTLIPARGSGVHSLRSPSREQSLSIHHHHAVMPVYVMHGADVLLPARVYLRHQALLVVLHVQAHYLVDPQAVSVTDETILRRPEQLPAQFKNPPSRARALKAPHHRVGGMGWPLVG